MSVKNDELNGFRIVNAKIRLWLYERLMRLLDRRKLNANQFFTNVADCFVRYTDDKHNLKPENEKTMAVFEHGIGWEDNFNLGDPSAKPEIVEATYYMVDKNGKKGVRIMHVERPFFGKWTQNFNIIQIFELLFCRAFPQLYKRWRMIAACRNCVNIIEVLTEVVTELEAEEAKKELLEDLQDNDRGDFGQHIHDRIKPKRQYNKSDDTLFKEDLI